MAAATTLHQIEISSRCNLSCRYCLHPIMTRPKVDISREHWAAALEWVRYFVGKGTQGELVLFGTGEPSLHPDFPQMAREARGVIGPGRRLVTTTNGIAVTKEWVDALKPSGIRVYVSLHRPEKAEPAVRYLKSAGLLEATVADAVEYPNDWAGQVKWHSNAAALAYDARPICPWTAAGQLFVSAHGALYSCCYANGDSPVLGQVTDAPSALAVTPWKACQSCWLRQAKPGEVFKPWVKR